MARSRTMRSTVTGNILNGVTYQTGQRPRHVFVLPPQEATRTFLWSPIHHQCKFDQSMYLLIPGGTYSTHYPINVTSSTRYRGLHNHLSPSMRKKKTDNRSCLGHKISLTGTKNPNVVELKNWHPATGGNVYGPDDPNSGPVDLVLPNNPAIITQATSRI